MSTPVQSDPEIKAYKVGGCVRDELLGIPHADTDWVVVGSAPEQMLELGYQQVGKDFPVFLHPKTKQEYALARTERKTGSGHTGFQIHASPDITLEQDLARRDLTVNAMAMDNEGNIIDPYHGADDLKNRTLRHVSPAFSEDPLRVLRLARFAAQLDFEIAKETQQLARGISASGELSSLAPERIWQELHKALSGPNPARFIEALRQLDALAVLFPEIDNLFGVPQTETYHPEIDTGVHLILALRIATQISDDPMVRFAVLVHDLGKGLTAKEKWPRHIAHEIKGVPLVKQLCGRYRIPSQYQRLGVLVSEYHLHAHRAFELKPATLLKLLSAADVFRRPETFKRFILACEADARGRKGLENKPYPQANFLLEILHATTSVSSKPIIADGYTGKQIGEQLHQQRLQTIKLLKANFS